MSVRRLGGVAAAFVSAATLLVGGLAAGSASSAEGAAKSTPGYCPTDQGVTVVVDFKELGGGIVIRCAAGPVVPGYSGLDALQDAGFTPEGVRQYGLAFICRIAGKPAPDQSLPIDGDPNYHEDCNQTPPQTAFWGYWYAPNGGSWTYSQVAAMSRDAIPGGFEGWSFSLNHGPGQAPPPGVAPKRPPHQPPPPTSPPPTKPPTHRPPTHRPPTHQPPSHHPSTHPSTSPPTHPSTRPSTQPSSPTHTGHPASQGAGGSSQHPSSTPPTGVTTKGAGSSTEGPTTTTSTGSATATTTDAPTVANPLAVGHNAAGEQVSGELPDAAPSDSGSAGTTFLVIGLVAVLLAGGGLAAWRRRASRE